MCRNQEILPGSASLFLRYLLISNLLRLWNTLYLGLSTLACRLNEYWSLTTNRLSNAPSENCCVVVHTV
ncbi:MAG: hypothetical protein J6386_18330 [Candidatus Synoicihabitans palmerolidicus]|nr:hypothetical protein [Candidatus Synoicihabitans palmerolidicus]